ncbi:MAG: acyltransferase [Myxococcales bacterium]|nr:acyltransferase [Myxococcales bacterium]
MTAVASDEPGLASARGLAIVGVVLGHAALSFLATPIGWAVRDDARWLGADAIVWILRQFLMPAFFVVAGLAAARLLDVRGVGGYLRQRARRIALPLALALVPVSLAMNALWDWGRTLAARAAVAETVPRLRASTAPVTLAHLWFLYYLLALSLAALAIALALGPRRRRGVTAALDALTARPLATVVLASLPTWACLQVDGTLQLDTPLGFAIDPVVAGYFGWFFAWGWWLARRRAGLAALARAVPGLLALAVAATAAAIPALLAARDGDRPSALATAVCALGSWAWVLALLGGARRWLPVAPRWLARCADDSLWIYVAHLPLVVLLQLGAAHLAAPGPLEYAGIAAAALAGSALIARGLRRAL